MRADRLKASLGDTLVHLGSLLVVGVLVAVVLHVLWSGLSSVSLSFLLEAPARAGRAGGIAPMIVSTLIVALIALVTAVPLGVAIALLLTEERVLPASLAKAIRLCLVVLAAVPSILYGLVGNAVFSDAMGLGFSLLSGGLTLALMVLPIIACIAEESIRAVPDDVRRGGYALGLPRHRVIFRLILPLALPGIVAGTALGFGRAVAESAALIFTSGYVDRMPDSVFDSGRTLAVHILDLAMNVPGGDARAFATASVLLISTLATVAALAALERAGHRTGGST